MIFEKVVNVSKTKSSHELESIADKLRLLFTRAYQAETAYVLTLVIYEIIGLYDLPFMAPLQAAVIALYSDDAKICNQLEVQTRQEIREVYEKIEVYAAEYDIQARDFREQLACFKAAENLPPELGLNSTPSQYKNIRFALFFLPKDSPNYHEFVGQFAKLLDKNEISQFTFVPTLDLWEKEKQRFEKMRSTTVWHSWDSIANAYLMHDPEKAAESISVPETKHHLHRLEDYTMAWFEKQKPSRAGTPKKQGCPTYKAAESILKINGVSIDFEPKSIRASLLKCFFKNGKAQDKKFSLEEIYAKANRKKIGHFTLERADKDAIYGARNGVNSVVLEKVGVNDFLVLEKSKISINPQYLK